MAKMMDETLFASLEALENGESIDSILFRYSALATALQPFLETAVSLKNQATNPTIAAQSASLVAMKKEAARLRPRKQSGFALFFHHARRFAPAMALAALLLLSLMTAVASPNSLLYGARQVLDGWRNTQQENDGVVDVPVKETAVSPTPTIKPTITAPPSATTTMPAATPSATPTATETLMPSATPTPTLTAAPSPAPTATAVDDDESDDDESDDDKSDDDKSDDEPESG